MPRDHRKSVYSRGAIALGKKVRRSGLSQKDFAKTICGTSQQVLSNWLCGFARPTPEKMAELQKRLGIPMAAWTQLEDRTAA